MDSEEIEQNLNGVMRGDEITIFSSLNRLSDMLESKNLIVDDVENIANALIECIIGERNIAIRSEIFNVLEKTFKCLSSDPDLDRLVNSFDYEDDAFIANTLLLLPRSGKKIYIPVAEKYLDHPNTFIAKNAAYALKHLKI